MNRVLIAVPCMDMVPTEYVNALLQLRKPEGTQIAHLACSLVYVAREMLADVALKGKFSHILFLDSDMFFPANTLTRLLSLDLPIVSGLAFMRKPPFSPCIYKEAVLGEKAEHWKDYPQDKVTEVAACGLACCLIKAEVLESIKQKGSIFIPINGIGEDISFCLRARNCGYKIYADTGLKIGHIGQRIYGEGDYKAWQEC